MRFSDHIASAPRPFDKDRGDDVLKVLPWAGGDTANVLRGTAGCSPYLAGLMSKEADWLEGALDDVDGAVKQIFDVVRAAEVSGLSGDLRKAKRRIALLTGLCDVAEVWPLEQVTRVLSDFAALSVDHTIKTLVAEEIERNRFPGLEKSDVETAGGYITLAMGKMGAGELNYSSDIDLICLFDDARFDRDDVAEARAHFVKITRKMSSVLSEITSEGYVFRTDLRLRPDPSVTPVCLSVSAAERYYEAEGRTWERAAFIKAAPCGGDMSAGDTFLKNLKPFVWRKHLDFAAIQDAHDMRLRIKDHKGFHGSLDINGHNVKLGQGGIREIEFFAQTRQLIAGGRDETLRQKGTIDALKALEDADWIGAETTGALSESYRRHRVIEHRLQMINDAQTHDLPSDEAGFQRLADFLDMDVSELRSELTRRFTDVHAMTEGFFAPKMAEQTDAAPLDWGNETVEQWRRYPAFRSPRAMAIFDRLWPGIRSELIDAPKPDEALARFDEFLSGLPAGVQLFSLFEANPQLTKLIVDIVATAPALASYLARHSGVLDAVLGGSFFKDWPGISALIQELTAQLEATSDYETKLNAARKWAAERHFQIGVHQLRGLIDADTSAREYAELAEAVVAAIWPVVCGEFSRKHGKPPGQGAAVVAMGSLGAGRLNAVSDLDLIVIYDAEGIENSDGPRPLATRPYYARLTQALITALSAPMADGRLYEVDMRLRPSGRQGPVATSLSSFDSYQHNDAWTWEHLALTRARVIAGPAELGARIRDIRIDVLRTKSSGSTVLGDAKDMRERLALAKPADSGWDMRNGPGRLQDLELFAQTAALRSASSEISEIPTDFAGQIALGVASGWLNDADSGQLLELNAFLWRIHAAARLLTGKVLDPEVVGTQGRNFVMRVAESEDLDVLERKIDDLTASAALVISKRLESA